MDSQSPTRPRRIRRRGSLALISTAALVAAGVTGLASCQGDNSSDGAAQGTSAAETSTAPDGPVDFTMPAYDPRTKPVQPGPKTFELTTTEKNVKVGDKVYRMWTFNNSVPGPVLRAVQGDTVTIKIKNDKSSQFFHSVDYHASRLTLGGGHVQVAPGKAGEFKFKLDYPGVFMYHCATAPVLHHIGMGMYGMIIVQPKKGFGRPMPEYAITQSEIYGSLEDINTNNEDAMAFNGIPAQYLTRPIKVKANSDARFFVLNAGPSEQSSFHIVGTIFDKAYDDGNPFNLTVGRQTLNLPASGSTVLEAKFVGEGQFPFVTHQFDHAAKGAIGMILAGDGKPGPGGASDPGANGHH
ncbi:MAG: multicopper oxidase domain-containing protein [Thermoleophilia bacterium]|nr:multicopper oxidase domain-containing protein [Thermoleophilia bacterium]